MRLMWQIAYSFFTDMHVRLFDHSWSQSSMLRESSPQYEFLSTANFQECSAHAVISCHNETAVSNSCCVSYFPRECLFNHVFSWNKTVDTSDTSF